MNQLIVTMHSCTCSDFAKISLTPSRIKQAYGKQHFFKKTRILLERVRDSRDLTTRSSFFTLKKLFLSYFSPKSLRQHSLLVLSPALWSQHEKVWLCCYAIQCISSGGNSHSTSVQLNLDLGSPQPELAVMIGKMLGITTSASSGKISRKFWENVVTVRIMTWILNICSLLVAWHGPIGRIH